MADHNDDNKLPMGTVKGARGDRKVDKPVRNRIRYSNFFITINTNQPYTGYEENYEEKVEELSKVLEDIFNIARFGDFVTIPKEHKWTREYIKKADTEFATELSPKNGLLHAHIMSNIHHYSNVKLDITKIREHIIKTLKLPGLYLNVRTFHNSQANLEEYIRKYVK